MRDAVRKRLLNSTLDDLALIYIDQPNAAMREDSLADMEGYIRQPVLERARLLETTLSPEKLAERVADTFRRWVFPQWRESLYELSAKISNAVAPGPNELAGYRAKLIDLLALTPTKRRVIAEHTDELLALGQIAKFIDPEGKDELTGTLVRITEVLERMGSASDGEVLFGGPLATNEGE